MLEEKIQFNSPYWKNQDSESRKLCLQPLDQNATCDVCVIGLGASGLTACLELRNSNLSVVAIDMNDVGSGAAGRNGGFMLAGTDEFYHDNIETYGREATKKAYLETVEELDYQFKTYPESCYRTGSLRIAQDQVELDGCKLSFEAMRQDNLQIEWYKGPHGEGYFCPTDGKFNPLLRCRILAQKVLEKGALLYSHTKAESLTGTEVVTDKGHIIKCRKVIVAVDGQLENILPELKERNVRTCRLQMVATEPTTDVNLPMPIHRNDDYWLQMPDGCVALGGFREQTEETEWTSDDTPAQPIQSWLDKFLKEHVGTNAKVTHRWGGLVTYSPNGPICEELREGVFAIGCYNGTGNILGTLYAKKAAKWATEVLEKQRTDQPDEI